MMDSRICLLYIIISCLAAKASSCFCDLYSWTSWSACSTTCGHGSQNRRRLINYDEYYWKNNCERMCTKYESRPCNVQLCSIVNCQLSDFGSWSDCDPCAAKQYRVRWVRRPAQFGGEPCTEPLSESRPCNPTKPCTIQETDCNKKFKCETGRCIDIRLKCNGVNDCGDNSDEYECRKRPVTQRRYGPIPGADLLGLGPLRHHQSCAPSRLSLPVSSVSLGSPFSIQERTTELYNLLSGESRGDIFDNMFPGVKHNIVSGLNRKEYFLPYNVENVTFKVTDEANHVTSVSYNSLNEFVREKDIPPAIKLENIQVSEIGNVLYMRASESLTIGSTFKEAIRSSYEKNSKYIRIHKVISVSEFAMRKDDLWLSNGFLKALNHLPLEYNYPLYSRIFDDYGTHYISKGKLGGSYDLLYQFSADKLKYSGTTLQQTEFCLRKEVVVRIFSIEASEGSVDCAFFQSFNETAAGTFRDSSEKSFSFVEGGNAKQASALGILRSDAANDRETYNQWKLSVADAPTILDFELKPITDLIKGIPCEVTKRHNLIKAYNEYLARFDPCQCSPCPNNARTFLAGTECMCICQPGTYGKSCETRAADYKSEAIDGSWNCWSSWSDCDASRIRRRTRQCNNPPPSKGGKPCDGLQTQTEQCFISLTENKGEMCINSEEFKKELGKASPKPESGCPKAEAPENGYIVNLKKWYQVAEEVEVMCFDGFDLQGYQFMRCLPDGTWEKDEVECI